jgi:ubiquinol-cytochrome c reductase cytochrome c subunit
MTDEFDADSGVDGGSDANAELTGLGFAPAVSATGADPSRPSLGSSRSRRGGWRELPRWRRRAAGLVVAFMTIATMGWLFGLLAPTSGASGVAAAQTQIDSGRQLFTTSCVTCHGANLQGVTDRGPSLIGVGSAAAYFQVSTGRMPAIGQGAEQSRKTNKFTEAETEAIAAYVQSVGGGVQLPDGSLVGNSSSLAEGGELFRLNCASCHGSTGNGAPLSAGKSAPGLNDASAKQIYAAMLSGPESMPVFNDNQLTAEQKQSVVAYVQTLQQTKDPGGNGIDRIGPVSEGIVLWVLGVGALVLVILWIGAKA